VTVHSGDKTSAFLPLPHQELLLKACLFEGEDALAAWQAWRGGMDLDQVDVHAIQLLPLMADKLQRWGVEDSALNMFRGLQRRTLVQNHLLFLAAGLALRPLGAARIPAMALTGVVLASTYYETMLLRPTDKIDLLVHPANILRTLDLLEGCGWQVMPGQFRPRVADEFAVQHSCVLQNSAKPGDRVDLHWRLLRARFSEEAETALWERAAPFAIDGAECLAPCAADMLVHVCTYSAMWNDVPPNQWVVDAAFIVRSGAVDWIHFRAQTERLGLALPVVETLNYLHTVMRIPVPDIVIQQLTQSHVKSIERLIYESGLQPPDQLNLISALRIHRHVAWNALARSEGLGGYWRYFVALRRGRSLPEMAKSVGRRLARSASS
jgi:hypothetical protein